LGNGEPLNHNGGARERMRGLASLFFTPAPFPQLLLNRSPFPFPVPAVVSYHP
jgi:hypothetical protein